MGRTWAEHVLPMFCACSFHGNFINNLLSYFGLVDAAISASEKVLPVPKSIILKQKKRKNLPPERIELSTPGLQDQCSTTEL